ncbi:hypothetical protein [Caballeronia sp. ATUFL_M1_KS5A]|uniref:hypothetical protein n=1 Tax=Caballeronia sp. ATUFL_M1_KS5A TaxID=2921778 RepID=UPI002028FAA0|nr:hypothetical protein [Caballeronia sp. ATUFL_M1_KS5A]
MEDYKSAAIRHLHDATALRDSGSLDNAGHLIGFAAECAIKLKISTLSGSAEAPHCHLPALLDIARKHLGSRANYSGMYDIVKGDIFKSWNVNRRYAASGHTTNEELEEWFSTTRRLFAQAQIKERK